MPNPYAHGLPAPVRVFAGREDDLRRIRDCVESCRAGDITHVFVEGEWGIGKTSLLNKLEPELQEHGPVISEDLAEGEGQTGQFYSSVFAELLEKEPQGLTADDFQGMDWGDHRRLRKLFQAAWEGLRERDDGCEVVIIMLDNLERARPEFLTGVRDVFQRLEKSGARFMLIFAGKRLATQGGEASEPVRRFFGKPILLRPLDEAASMEAIRKPVRLLPFSFTDDAARLVYERAAGHPYFLKLICHEIYDLLDGKGDVNSERLESIWPELEERLELARFGNQFEQLPEGEHQTLLHASLIPGSTFEAIELRPTIKKSLDIYLRRLSERELIRKTRRGVYELYHPLFRTYLQAKAREKKLISPTTAIVPEGRPVLGQIEVEERMERASRHRLDIIDEHFRGRGVGMLESLGSKKGVRIRILMGEDPQWSETLRRIAALPGDLRGRLEVRAWPDKSEKKPVPWHYRCLLGDREIWRFDHSLDGAGKKAARFTDDTVDRERHERDFERWWKESKQIFPPQ